MMMALLPGESCVGKAMALKLHTVDYSDESEGALTFTAPAFQNCVVPKNRLEVLA
jgi:hypothetical protein